MTWRPLVQQQLIAQAASFQSTFRRIVFFIPAVIAASWLGVPSAAAQASPGPSGPLQPRRQQLEEQFRQRTGELVRRRLALTSDQMSRLQAANRQFEPRRTQLHARERELRRELRMQLQSDEGANQERVAQLLDQTIQLHRQRLDLAEAEQRELAKFLTPVQRAQYAGIQAELRRRMQGLRERRMQRPPERRRPPRGQMLR